jgi:hypothetical protein
MPQENSQFHNKNIKRVEMLRNLETGILDSIECPQCHKYAVSVWFTHPQMNEYRTWFICADCLFKMRLQNSEKPPHYTEARVDARLETYDADVLKKKHFN